MFGKLKFANKIFIALFLMILLTAVSILAATIINYRKQSLTFAERNLKIKQKEVLESIDYGLDNYPSPITSENIFGILRHSIFGIADIHNVDINVFDTRGNLILTTEGETPIERVLPKQVLDSLSQHLEYIELPMELGQDKTLTTYRYITNMKNEPIAIINLPYKYNHELFRANMFGLLKKFGVILAFVLFIGGIVSWFLAKQITKKIELIAGKIKQTDVVIHNKPIKYEFNDELKPLVDSYNSMLEKLNRQSNILALTEREEAWREMARQVAHEIKNPLTPMRMMIQNYVRRYDPEDPYSRDKLKDISDTLITQIDTMSAIAEAFSDFARLPARKDEEIDVVETIRSSLEVFPSEMVYFTSSLSKLNINFDRIYLIRIITNLVKNAIQAIPEDRSGKVFVGLQQIKNSVILRISDNGRGIAPQLGDKIFEPKFTTTSGGTGLGLAMVKKIVEDYSGEIRYISEEGKGTEFIIRIPYEKPDF